MRALRAAAPPPTLHARPSPPQQRGQLLAPGAHREPLRVPDRWEAEAAQGGDQAALDRGPDDLVLAGVVGLAVALVAVGVGGDRGGVGAAGAHMVILDD